MPLFTDGSKDGELVASAACCRGYPESESLPGPSIYTAEINVLLIGLEMIANSNKKRFLVFSDSLPCMQALNNGDTSNSLLIQVDELTSLASLGFHIVFCWIPGHIGIKGNEKVDRAVKAA